MSTTEWLEELVQLYEYRVEDLQAGRSPRGTRQSFQTLREALLFSDGLDGPTRSRLQQTERLFRNLQREGQLKFDTAPRRKLTRKTSKSKPGGQAATQHNTVKKLSDRLWAADARRWVFARLWATRTEPRLMSLRLMISATDNLERQQHGEGLKPLISLEEAVQRSLIGLPHIEALTDTVLTLMTTFTGRKQLTQAVQDILSLNHGAPSATFVSAATEYDPREKPVAAFDPDQSGAALMLDSAQTGKPLWQEEELLLKRAAATVLMLLEGWPASSPRPLPAVMGIAPESPEPQVADSDTLLIDLSGLPADGTPRLLDWAPLQLQLQRVGAASELRVAASSGQTAQLNLLSDLPAKLRLWSFTLEQQLIHAVLEGDLLLLRSEQAAPQALQILASQARLGAALTQPHQSFANMRLARAAALLLRGRSLASTDLSAASGERYANAEPGQLGALAARGLEALLTLSRPLPEWERTAKLAEAAEALGLSAAEGHLLADLLGAARIPDTVFAPETLNSGGFPLARNFILLDAPKEAMTFGVDGETVTLAPYTAPEGQIQDSEDLLLGLSSGHYAPQPLDDLLIWTLPQTSLVLAQHGDLLAQTTVPYGAQ